MNRDKRENKGWGPVSPLSWLINRLIRLLVAVFLWPLFLPRVQGPRLETEEGQGCVLIANHHSLLDPIFISLLYRSDRLSFVAKQELYATRIIGRVLKAFAAIPLDRSTADLRASKTILAKLKEGRILGIFLQGTRLKLEEAADIPPHSSLLYYAVRRGIPVMSVAINPRYRLFGRPLYVFGPPVRYRLKDMESLSPADQDGLAREIMRRLYQMAGLAYDYEGADANRAFFQDRLEVLPVPAKELKR